MLVRALCRFVPWLLVVGIAGCGGTPAVDLGEEPAPEALEFPDWRLVDWRLDRWILGKVDFKLTMRNWRTRDPEAAFRRAMTYTAEWDSLGLGEFLARPADQRAARRRAAGRHHHRAQIAIRDPANGLWIAARDGFVPCTAVESDCPPPAGTDQAVTRAMGRLVQATGIDPSNPSAWYQLGYLSGTVGDRDRQRTALGASLAAAEAAPRPDAPELNALRRRARLDLAWLARDLGLHEEAQAQLDTVADTPGYRLPESHDERTEAILVRGLVHAARGEWVEAQALARQVLAVPVRQRNHRLQVSVPATIYAPTLGFNKTGWITVESDFMNRWILAWLDLAQGYPEDAVRRLGNPMANLEYPPGLAHRFWQDRGLILEAAGDRDLARRSFDVAAFYTPFMIYFPMSGFRGLDSVHGLTGSGGIYFLGHRRHFTAGSLFGYAANLEQAWEVATDGPERQALGREVETMLTACIERGLDRPAALALRGRVHLLEGAPWPAHDDLLAAAERQERSGAVVPDVLIDLGVAQLLVGDHASAETTLARYVEARPRDAAGWNLLGVAQARGDRYETALETLAEALEQDPEAGEIWYNRGLVLLNSHRPDLAREHFAQALNLLPGDPRIRQMLEVAEHVRTGTVALAITPDVIALPAAEKTRLTGGMNRPALQPAAAVDGLDGLSAEAREAVLARLEADYRRDRDPQSLQRLVWANLEAGRPARVQQLLQPGWRDLDDDTLVLLLRADRERGDPDRALILAGSLETTPGQRPHAELWALVAATCLDTGHHQHARRALARARELDPLNAALRQQAGFLESGS